VHFTTRSPFEALWLQSRLEHHPLELPPHIIAPNSLNLRPSHLTRDEERRVRDSCLYDGTPLDQTLPATGFEYPTHLALVVLVDDAYPHVK
jgi:hypothetical protein